MKKDVTPIKPTFKHNIYLCMQTLTNFPFIEEDFDAITNYELLCKVVEYLNKIAANDNTQNEIITQLSNAFNELLDYVNNYFDNLDVQEEINNKLDEMVEDGTFEEIISDYITHLRFIRVSDYYEENDYIDLPNLYNIAITNKKAIYIDGTYKVKDNNMVINEYIEVFGGKLIVDSFESTNNDTFDVFFCNAPCYIHDIEIVSVADRIPSINRHAGIEYGYASNVKVAELRSGGCIFERITGDFISGIGIYHASDILTNIKIDKCYFNHCELGMYCERGEFTCTNSTFIQSTDVQSIYYHPFYIAYARNSNIDNIEIGNNALVHPNVNLTSYLLPDIIHLWNASDSYEYDSYNINITNINVRGEGFKKFCQARFIHDINFNNINASIQKYFLEIGNRFSNINFNNCNINNVNYDGQARIVITTNDYVLASTDNLRINNSKFTFTTSGSQYFDCCNVTLNNCSILADSNLTLPRNNSVGGYLKVNNCYITLNRLSNLYLGTGYVEYNNCYFDNQEAANYINSDIQNTLNIKVLNCYFTYIKNMFDSEKINSNVCYNVYGKNPDSGTFVTMTNFTLRT